MRVCITAAGTGSRMGEYGCINKALLPVEGKAAISHIIERFPAASFVVALGHQGQQVRDYMSLAHPELDVIFVEVPAFTGEGTGPLRSLYECRDALQEPFYFVACDTLIGLTLPGEIERNQVYYGRVQQQTGYSFVNFDSDEVGLIVTGMSLTQNMDFSESCSWAFTGLMAIADYAEFWTAAGEALKDDKVEIYEALNRMMEQRPIYARRLDEWRDIGTRERYRRVIAETTNFDFSKPDEFLYVFGDRVIKWFADAEITKRRVERAKLRPHVFPTIEGQANGFYSYRFLEGQTLYEDNDLPKFHALLCWLSEHVWAEDGDEIAEASRLFYASKTLKRLALFRQKYPDWADPKMVNGEPVQPIQKLLRRADLDKVAAAAIPSFIHGDLQFDNIIYGPEGFRLLDWRQDFGGRLDVGDLYYDLAKLLGGIRLNYAFVKRNLLSYEEKDGCVKIDVMQSMMTNAYEKLLLDYIAEQGLSVQHTEVVLGLIYLNMAPLHHAPFDKFLFALAQRTLTNALDDLR